MNAEGKPSIASAVGLEDAQVELLYQLQARQSAAGRLRDAWETLDVLTSLCPFDARPWKLLADVERRRGREEQAQVCEEMASWCA